MMVLSKTRKQVSVMMGEEIGTLALYWRGCKMVQLLWEAVWWFLKMLKIEPPYDPAIPLLDMYLKKRKILTQKDIRTLCSLQRYSQRLKCGSHPGVH